MKTSATTEISGDRKFGVATVELPKDHEADVILVLPSGQEITLQYRLESPSIDVCMGQPLGITNWCDDDLTPAKPRPNHPERFEGVKQLCIDIPPEWVDKKRKRKKKDTTAVVGTLSDEQQSQLGGIIDRKQHLEYLCFMMLDALDHDGLQSVLERAARKDEDDNWRRFYGEDEEGDGPVQGYNIPRLLKEWRDTTDELCQTLVAANQPKKKKK